ncbi:CLUMA_CG002328, isoform A [Clunio marinus]|uniref:CLUMA_CG002328, isoform A n=1 Tax=Clunio marinus TaxID=568069 RepID=A0A1J1HLS2_9DIPT|nr:CLUMA_CG002328, isoform A [Clunio marinus]
MKIEAMGYRIAATHHSNFHNAWKLISHVPNKVQNIYTAHAHYITRPNNHISDHVPELIRFPMYKTRRLHNGCEESVSQPA